jgi:hypothetical protein
MGGFDQNRVVGPISNQQGSPDSTGAIDLVDISLNVITGESPWNFSSSMGGILASGNSSMGPNLPIAINSLNPYLSLPPSTCNAIAEWLPVSFNPKFGLYFWNTTDPAYEQIVTSPSTLGFTFRLSDTTDNFTINVPFSLLNLTMEAPLMSSPTPYFPCQPTTNTHFQLGRTFLQAAFVGMNYDGFGGKAAWWLAQAPGPNIPTQSTVLAILDKDTTISNSSNNWADTWTGYWKPLTKTDVTPTTSSTPSPASVTPGTSSSAPPNAVKVSSSSGLSTGAKAGIGIAAAAAVIAALIGAFFLWRHFKKSAAAKDSKVQEPDYSTVPAMTSYYDPAKPQQQIPASPSHTHSTYVPSTAYSHPGITPVEMNSEPVRHELH